ncbi:MAG: GNAT family N-acetyltransferase [Oscillospiraceae bacterium]|nr:GNAT family N-acetyltransferase [Oscillospiraceae bacterium]
MQIRQVEQKDFDKVLEMMKVFYASDALLIHPKESVLRKTLADAIEAGPYVEGFVFFREEELAGYGMIAKSYSTEVGGRCVWIEDIYIKPEFRGQGFGTGFLRYVEDRYRDWAVRLRLEAEEENENAMQVYRNAGFELLGYVQLVKKI